MLKYQLRKDVTLEDGMAFKYKSHQELKALIIALNKKCYVDTEKVTYGISKGFLIIMDTKKEYLPLVTSKFFTRSDQYLVKKKDVFNKTEYDNGPKKNKGSFGKYDNESNLREQNDVNNNECSSNIETQNKPFVAYALTDGCGLRVPLETCKEGVLTDTHRLKGLFMEGAEKDSFADKLYIAGIERDRITKLVSSNFPLFIRTGIDNILSPTPSVSFKIPGTGYGLKITLEGEKVVDIVFNFDFNDTYTNVVKELIASYFKVEKPKTKEGTKFESVTDLNGESRVLMTDSKGNKTTLI